MRDKIISILESKIYINGKNLSYFLNDIEEIYDVIQSKILSNDCKSNILVSSEKIGIDVCILIIVAINIYLEDLKNCDNNILSKLEEDQIVVYDGRKYRYKGCEIDETGYFENKELIVLESSNGLITRTSKENAYKLIRYFGNSEKLNNIRKKNDNKEGRFLISKLLDLDMKELVGTLNQQVLVVFKSKQYMQYILDNLEIEIDNKKYEFGTLFPTKYYSNIDKFSDIKGNNFHLKTIFLFTSKFDVAYSLIRIYKNCNKLILLEEESYKKSIDKIEDYTLRKKQLKKIIFFNTYTHIDVIENLIKKDSKVHLIEEKESLKVKNILIESNEINKLLDTFRKELINLDNRRVNFIQSKEFLEISFSIFKIFQLSCIPISELKEVNIIESIEKINKIIENNYNYTDIYKKLLNIYQILNSLYNLLLNNNPKLEILRGISDQNSIILLNNSFEIEFIKTRKIRYKELINVKDLKYLKLQNEKLIFVSFYNNKMINQFNLYNSNRVVNLLYHVEVLKYNSIAKKINSKLKFLYDNLNLKSKKIYIDIIKYENDRLKEKKLQNLIEDTEMDYNSFDEDDFDFFDKTQEILTKSFKISNRYDYNNGYERKAYKKIIFKNNKYAYLTKNYKVSCIDNKNTYIVKNVDNLNIDDVIVFINKKSEKDIDIMFEKIINSDIFRKEYSRDFQNLNYFKDSLNRYNIFNEGGYEILSRQLSVLGIKRDAVTIKQWTEKKIIGPREKEIYQVIGNIIEDKYLKNNWEIIYNSSQIIRSFKSKLKKIIKKVLKNENLKNTDDEVIKLIIDIFGNKDGYVDLVEVNEIVDVFDEQLTDIQLNCLLG